MTNVRTKAPSEKKAIESAPALSGEAGTAPGQRLFLCIGPMCWGRGETVAKAVKNAKANRVRIYEKKWCWILYDIASDVTVDDMGGLCWKNDSTRTDKPYTEILRYNM